MASLEDIATDLGSVGLDASDVRKVIAAAHLERHRLGDSVGVRDSYDALAGILAAVV
ncbi:hypothetical protein [Streptomyces sp. NPDC056061]|uniref:hypothetical protein n=1 Tax=Streptomyces sp. NPDC056061 TaxID=3345700 RepID=UPI0035DA4FAA